MKAVSLIALQLACVNVCWIQKTKRGLCREDMMYVLAGDVLSDPPDGHNSRKVGLTTVTGVTALTNPMRASLTRTARRGAVTDQSHARFTDMDGASYPWLRWSTHWLPRFKSWQRSWRRSRPDTTHAPRQQPPVATCDVWQ